MLTKGLKNATNFHFTTIIECHWVCEPKLGIYLFNSQVAIINIYIIITEVYKTAVNHCFSLFDNLVLGDA